MIAFDYFQPTRIHFGENKLAELGTRAKAYGTKAFLVTTPNEGVLKPLFQRAKSILEDAGLAVCHFEGVVPNPTTDLMDDAILMAADFKPDVVIGLGGGSSIDTAKMVALANGKPKVDWQLYFSIYTSPFGRYSSPYGGKIPMIAISTTSGTGSQVTQAAVVTDPKTKDKATVIHPDCFPTECIVDYTLMVSLPKSISAATGFDAFCHGLEAYINPKASLYTEMLSLTAIRSIVQVLPKVLEDGSNLAYRARMAFADTLGGTSLANTGADIPHPLSEIICGVCPQIAHGQSLAMVYPGYADYKWSQEPYKFAQVAKIFDPTLEGKSDEEAAAKFPAQIRTFLKELDLDLKLSDFGPTQEEQQEILNFPVLTHLPMAPKDILQEILKTGFNSNLTTG